MSRGFSFMPVRFQDPEARADATSARGAAREAQTEIRELRDEVERLLMISEALWTVLKQKFGLDDGILAQLINDIDLRDGKLDGRVARDAGPADLCPQCARPILRKRSTCIYCGAQLDQPAQPFQR